MVGVQTFYTEPFFRMAETFFLVTAWFNEIMLEVIQTLNVNEGILLGSCCVAAPL